MRAPRLGTWRAGPGLLIAGLVAASVFWIAYDNGSYALESRNTVAIALWWAVVLVLAFGLLSRETLTRASLLAGGLLAALAVWTLASLAWSSDAEASFNEFNRVTLYLGAFTLVTVAASRRQLGSWADGLAVVVAAVAAVALVSRLFPGSFPNRELAEFLPSAVTRLSFPLGYWNGLAIFVGLGVPLLIRIAVIGRSPVTRGLALVPVPLIAAVIYLASSRGGFVTVVVGSIVFLALVPYRWAMAAALASSTAGAAATVAVLLTRDELVNGPLGTNEVESQGRSAAALIALVCLAVGALYGAGCRFLAGRIRPGRTAGRMALTAVLLAAAVAVVAVDPVERFETFRAPPQELETIERGDFVTAHLLSGSGSGRWQFWSAAVNEWQEFPLNGEGAGAYEAWWAEHAPFTHPIKDAHSLYLESLGELGPVGFGLAVVLAIFGIGVGVRRALATSGDLRVTVAALAAVFTAYTVAAGFDWVWELTAVSVVAFVALALVCRQGAVPASLTMVERGAQPSHGRRSFGVGVAAVLTSWVLVFAQAIPLLAEREVGISQAAVQRNDLEDALDAAEVARDIQPWASTPYLQLSLVREKAGQLPQARSSIRQALDRDSRDWRLWLISARIETKLGRASAAERSLRRAAELNPRSPLFAGLVDVGDE